MTFCKISKQVLHGRVLSPRPGRLRDKSLIEEDFCEVVIAPAGHEAFVFNADFRSGFIFQQAQCGPSQDAEVRIGMPFAQAAAVFSECHVQLPVQIVFDPPVPASGLCKSLPCGI